MEATNRVAMRTELNNIYHISGIAPGTEEGTHCPYESTLTSALRCQEARDEDHGSCLPLVNVGERWDKAAKNANPPQALQMET